MGNLDVDKAMQTLVEHGFIDKDGHPINIHSDAISCHATMETCNNKQVDCISRQDVLDEAFEVDTKEYGRIDVVGVDAIKSLQPINPQPKQRTGHWIKTISENGITSAVRCSECGFEDNRYMLFRYCPNCGCTMVEQESEDKE